MARVKASSDEKNTLPETLRVEQENKERRMEGRLQLMQYQPVAFDLLNRAIAQKKISHAYLFYGAPNTKKYEMAILFAQSILMGVEDGLVKEEELSEEDAILANRIATLNYRDMLVLDGTRKKKLSKKEIDDLQVVFSKTASEKSGRKLYILNHCENMSYEAANSLLKFLEEPTGEVYAILTCDSLEHILPTIQSRCLPIPFRVMPSVVHEEMALKDGLDPEDAYFISFLQYGNKRYEEVAASYSFQTAKTMLKQFLGVKNDPRLLLVDFDLLYKSKATSEVDEHGEALKDRDVDLDTLRYFYTMVIRYYQDVIMHECKGPTWYNEVVEHASKTKDCERLAKKLAILIEEKDQLNRVNDLSLVLYQTIYRLEVNR